MGLRKRVPRSSGSRAPINPRLVTLAISSGRRQGELAQRVDLAKFPARHAVGSKNFESPGDKFSVRLIIINSDEA